MISRANCIRAHGTPGRHAPGVARVLCDVAEGALGRGEGMSVDMWLSEGLSNKRSVRALADVAKRDSKTVRIFNKNCF